jgi:hypothetical protein
VRAQHRLRDGADLRSAKDNAQRRSIALEPMADRRQRTDVPDVAGEAEYVGLGGGQRAGDLVDRRRRRKLEDRDVLRANREVFDDVRFQIEQRERRERRVSVLRRKTDSQRFPVLGSRFSVLGFKF